MMDRQYDAIKIQQKNKRANLSMLILQLFASRDQFSSKMTLHDKIQVNNI